MRFLSLKCFNFRTHDAIPSLLLFSLNFKVTYSKQEEKIKRNLIYRTRKKKRKYILKTDAEILPKTTSKKIEIEDEIKIPTYTKS